MWQWQWKWRVEVRGSRRGSKRKGNLFLAGNLKRPDLLGSMQVFSSKLYVTKV
jgi:hypothetical protein